MQQRCFCLAKTRRQYVHGWTGWLSEASFVLKTRLFPIYMDVYREKVYTDVHLLAGYLYRLFPKVFSHYTAPLLRRIGKSVHPCTLLPANFGGAETSLLFNTSGIRAAGSKLQQVFRQKNLLLYSVHGRTLYNMPAGVFYTLLASASSISKRLFFAIDNASAASRYQKCTRMYTSEQYFNSG